MTNTLGTITPSYDGLSRRAKIVEKVNGAVTSSRFYLWCGGEICEERSGTSGDTVTKRYFPQGVQAGGTPYSDDVWAKRMIDPFFRSRYN